MIQPHTHIQTLFFVGNTYPLTIRRINYFLPSRQILGSLEVTLFIFLLTKSFSFHQAIMFSKLRHLFKSGNNSVSFLNVVEAGAPLDTSNVFMLPLLSSSDLFDPRGIEVCSGFRGMTPKL